MSIITLLVPKSEVSEELRDALQTVDPFTSESPSVVVGHTKFVFTMPKGATLPISQLQMLSWWGKTEREV